jgi:hypothetical protein
MSLGDVGKVRAIIGEQGRPIVGDGRGARDQ